MRNNTFPQLFSINLKNYCVNLKNYCVSYSEPRQRVGASPRHLTLSMRGNQYYILYIIIIYYNI